MKLDAIGRSVAKSGVGAVGSLSAWQAVRIVGDMRFEL